ncbi:MULTISPECIES: hypothetical protein [unclassified Nostoc]|uniref:hypothetical protein n=1 Tax=unclassified Nostoc TaxID=2593658 RepID=UPI000B952D6E|nr:MULTISPECIES: hypothetical protein [unclassified Nostoc]MDZ7987030.1 hypothetical protein [Nostoc sp. DedVER02]MDZ8116547.1 hypothetical protein [Nostoc sp. DedVER01b]OYE04163.1 hypothetical protein CDG79_14395 [Nostoc sp. 'Peltigera membranacea cyanobiont' 232]
MEELDFADKINQKTTIQGIAQNASLGAVLMTDDYTPVYLDGIPEWDSNIAESEIVVTGILRRRSIAPKATINPKGEVSHGVDSDSYILESPTWTIAP